MANQKGQSQVLILAGIVLLIAVAGGIFYLGRTTLPRQDSSGQTAPKPQSQNVAIPSPQPSPLSSDPTVNWKTYISNEFGFSFKYPPDWTVNVRQQKLYGYEIGIISPTFIGLEPNEYSTGPIKQPLYDILIKEYKNPNKLSLTDLVTKVVNDNKEPYMFKVNFTKETINSYTVYTTGDIPSQDSYICKFFTQDESRYLAFCIEPQPYNPNKPLNQQNLSPEIMKRIQYFNQILSTFKFTN